MSTSAAPRADHRTRVEWVDTDAAGIYHNTALVRFVEAAEAALMRAHGVDGYFPVAPRVRYEVDYEQPLVFGQEVVATVVLERLGASSMTFAFEVWGEEHGGRLRARVAHGRYVTVHVEGTHRCGTAASAPWPRRWADALGSSGHPDEDHGNPAQ